MVGQRQALAVNQQSHLDNGVGAMFFAGTSAPQFVFLIDFKIVISDVVESIFLISTILLLHGLVDPGLQIQVEAVEIIQASIHGIQRRSHGFKELVLLVIGLLFGARVENAGIYQQAEDGV